MKKWISLDYGKARIGIAISDREAKISFPLGLIVTKKTAEGTLQELQHYLKSRLSEVEGFVIGLPLLMNGQESPLSQEVREFGKLIESFFKKQVLFFDERLSSKEASSYLREAGLTRKKQAQVLDQTVAALLLQTFLDQRNSKN